MICHGLRYLRYAGSDNAAFEFSRWKVDMQVQTSTFERVGQVPGVVTGEEDKWL